MTRRIIPLALSVALATIAGSVRAVQATTPTGSSDRLILACNEDGTYTCGNSCRTGPNPGKWCCEM
jgi:hypothetical protein